MTTKGSQGSSRPKEHKRSPSRPKEASKSSKGAQQRPKRRQKMLQNEDPGRNKMRAFAKRENLNIYYVFERPLCENINIYCVFERSENLISVKK